MNTVLITGAGSGIGAAVARQMSRQQGLRLILMGRTVATLSAVRNSCARSDVHAVLPCDVGSADEVVAALASAEANLGTCPLVGVFANAGIGGPNAFGPGDRWEEILRINLTGVYNTAMAAYPHLQQSNGTRHVVVTSSVLARFGVPGQTAYVASKTGLLGLVRSLAVAWSPEGILVNAVCPGWVDTDMARASIQALADLEGISFEASKRKQEALLPAGRMTSPEEMATWIEFLFRGLGEGSSEARVATFTGQALDVNSGSWMG